MSLGGTETARPRVLIVEDSSVFREMQGLLLGQAGYVVSSHDQSETALAAAAEQCFDLAVIDYNLAATNGEELMLALRRLQPKIEVIFVSSALTVDLAIRLTHQGVAGIFNKPANPKALLEKIAETLARHADRDTAARLGSNSPLAPGRLTPPAPPPAEPAAGRLAYVPRFLPGSSTPFRELTHRLWKVRDFRAVLLLQGEAGSPFDLFAREMAEISMFRDGPIMACDAARFEPRVLIEVLAPALLSPDAGTLIVTGVETFTAAQQRTLENLMGGRDVFLPFVRRFRLVLAATSALSARVADGRFDRVLFQKISEVTLAVPSLRELRHDVVTIARRILMAHRETGHPASPIAIAPDAAAWIEAQDWPGNYDELTRTLLAAVRFATGDELTVEAITTSWLARSPAAPSPARA